MCNKLAFFPLCNICEITNKYVDKFLLQIPIFYFNILYIVYFAKKIVYILIKVN